MIMPWNGCPTRSAAIPSRSTEEFGTTLLNQGRSEEALQVFDKAVQLRPMMRISGEISATRWSSWGARRTRS